MVFHFVISYIRILNLHLKIVAKFYLIQKRGGGGQRAMLHLTMAIVNKKKIPHCAIMMREEM